MKKSHKILELNLILDKLVEEFILKSNKKNFINSNYLLDDLNEINKMLDSVYEASLIIERYGRFPLFFSENVNFLINKTSKAGELNPSEIVEVIKFLDTIKASISFEEVLDNFKLPKINYYSYTSLLTYPKNLNLKLKQIVDLNGEILDSASVIIKQIRQSIYKITKEIQVKLNEIVSKNSSKLTSNLISIRNERYVIAVKNEYKNQIKGITHDISSSGETIFIEPEYICTLNNKLNTLKEELKKEISRVLREASVLISLESDVLIKNYEIIENLDIIFSKASLSLKLKGNRVNINKNGIVELLNCHHPLLEGPNIVSNNILIGKDYQGIIITGPNTGGKTVLLKTIGLLSLMVKMGLLIPCDPSSNLNIFDDCYADIGDEQSIHQNLSTFSSHLKNVIDIMNEVTSNSLILLDELGSGTDPVEGASLAIAIFEYILSKKCLIIATSHYAELKIHAYQSNNIINASVEFDINSLKPTYKLLIGIPGESNAIKISKLLGLNEDIINNAQKYVYNNNNESSEILKKLTNQSLLLDKKLSELKEKESLLDKKLNEADNLIDTTHKEQLKILEDANKKANQLIKDSLKKSEDLLEELNKMKTTEIKNHELANKKFELKNIKNAFEEDVKPVKTKAEVNVFDKVFIEKYNASGTVTKVNKDKDKYQVSIGNTTVTVKKDELKLTDTDVLIGITSSKKTIIPKKTVLNRLDLRGMRYEEAENLIDNYIYDAQLAGLKIVTIIHGFGTGVIRNLVLEKIKNNSLIENYRFGGQNEGGLGVTVATLK